MTYTNSLNTHNGRIGKLGEDFACEYLVSKGHKVIERNIRMKIGEIDIVTSTPDTRGSGVKLHIIEVKTSQSQSVRPEENMNSLKMRKVARLGEAYSCNNLYSIDFVGVTLNFDNSLKKIVYIQNLEIF